MKVYKFTASIFLDALSIQPDFKTMSGLHQAIGDDDFSPTLVKESYNGRLIDRICLKTSDEELNLILGSKRFDFVYSPGMSKKKEEYLDFYDFCRQASSKLSSSLSHLERRSHRLALIQSLALRELETSEIDNIRDRLMIFPKPYSDSKPFEWVWKCASKLEKTFSQKEESINFLTTLQRRTAIDLVLKLPDANISIDPSYTTEDQQSLNLLQFEEASSPFDEINFLFDINTSQRMEWITQEITHLLEDNPVQDGYNHPLEDLLRNYIQDAGYEAVTCIEGIFVEKASSCPSLASDILVCLGRIEPSIAINSGLLMAYLALAQSNVCLKEAGLRLIENWNLKRESVQSNLESYIQRECKTWLREYATEVLLSLPK